MASVKIDQFHGISPRYSPSLLGDGMAVVAHNLKLKNYKLVPLREPSVVSGTPILMQGSLDNIKNANSIHVWKKRDGEIEFMLFKGDTWLADGNIADDERTRVIVSGDTERTFSQKEEKESGEFSSSEFSNTPLVYIRDPETGARSSFPLAMNPLFAPRVTRQGGESPLDTANIRYTYFFVTWVNKYGYESPVSSQSKIEDSNSSSTPKPWIDGDLEYNDGDTVTVYCNTSSDEFKEAEIIRVYKVVTGTEEGRIQFISEFKPSAFAGSGDWKSVAVVVKDEDAGEVINEIECPYPDMRCILDVPGSYYCGFSPSHPKTVCFSDVNMLYSWPLAYQYDVKDNIVALAVTSNSVFALTDGWPYVLSGTDPSGMTVTKLAGPAACVSTRGVCVYQNACYFVSNAGLMCIYNDANAGTVCVNITDKNFTKDQWLSLNPSSCVMGQFDGALHLFFTKKDGDHYGLSIDLSEQQNAITTHDEVAKCVCTDNKTDKMYYVREGGV